MLQMLPTAAAAAVAVFVLVAVSSRANIGNRLDPIATPSGALSTSAWCNTWRRTSPSTKLYM